ncbi:hypothetical protein LOTGIDRAFT_164857 [Lottia gigantea]|uniref:U6 snRNA phosphodiesterase n=1 Tax=Lottia gigantea TaxID=225164 RepID=V4A4A4_LOTGI|nr:hypothetical protein LOTGIDRAFT_164857 [Lottia gigantea]ESO89820.1 hypothetical protein LOTGIDRAFT_164857 [Lottia gigantea]
MSLGIVSYSSSDEEGINFSDSKIPELTEKNLRKRKFEDLKLPVPDSIQNMFKQQKKHEDNPVRHEGRIRSFEHVEGNWATHVYIPYLKEDRFISMVDEVLKCLHPLDFHKMSEFHLSLSRTVTIRHHWIDSLTQSLQKSFQHINRFICCLSTFKFYTNDEKNRTFLSLQVSDSRNRLKELTDLVDTCFEEFHLEKYYKNPSYHISIGWCLNNVIDKITNKQHTCLQETLDSFLEENEDLNYIDVDSIQCKTGNKAFTFRLKDS